MAEARVLEAGQRLNHGLGWQAWRAGGGLER